MIFQRTVDFVLHGRKTQTRRTVKGDKPPCRIGQLPAVQPGRGKKAVCRVEVTDVLRRIAAIAPGDTAALEALLPDRWLATHPEHRLEQREEESREAQARRRRKRAARRLAITQ